MNKEGICTVNSQVIYRLLLLNDLSLQITSPPSVVTAYGLNTLRENSFQLSIQKRMSYSVRQAV